MPFRAHYDDRWQWIWDMWEGQCGILDRVHGAQLRARTPAGTAQIQQRAPSARSPQPPARSHLPQIEWRLLKQDVPAIVLLPTEAQPQAQRNSEESRHGSATSHAQRADSAATTPVLPAESDAP